MVHPAGLVLVGEQRRPDVDRHEEETVFEVSVFTLFLATVPYMGGVAIIDSVQYTGRWIQSLPRSTLTLELIPRAIAWTFGGNGPGESTMGKYPDKRTTIPPTETYPRRGPSNRRG